jgi:hypothetical protein
LRINLSNIDGTFSKVLFEGETPTGLYTLVTDGNELPAGTYFYTISTNGRVMKTLKVILKK